MVSHRQSIPAHVECLENVCYIQARNIFRFLDERPVSGTRFQIHFLRMTMGEAPQKR